MNKGIVITLIIILSILAIGLTAGFALLLNNNFNLDFKFDFNGKEMALIESKEVKYDSINNIEINARSMDVEVKQGEGENIKAELYSNTDKNPTIEIKNDVIKVDDVANNQISIGINNNRKKLVLYVPSEYLGEFNISAKSGDITLEIDASKNKVNISTSSGDIKLKDIGESNISASSGDIKIETATDKLNVTVTSGDIFVNRINKVAKLKTTSGNIRVNELNIKENSTFEATSGNITVSNNNCNCYVNASTTSGNSKVNKSDRKSEIELRIKTTSGNVNVN